MTADFIGLKTGSKLNSYAMFEASNANPIGKAAQLSLHCETMASPAQSSFASDYL